MFLPEDQDGKDRNVQKQFPQEAVLLVYEAVSWQAVYNPC